MLKLKWITQICLQIPHRLWTHSTYTFLAGKLQHFRFTQKKSTFSIRQYYRNQNCSVGCQSLKTLIWTVDSSLQARLTTRWTRSIQIRSIKPWHKIEEVQAWSQNGAIVWKATTALLCRCQQQIKMLTKATVKLLVSRHIYQEQSSCSIKMWTSWISKKDIDKINNSPMWR